MCGRRRTGRALARPWLGATIRVWIVDVDGTRLFIAGETKAEVDPSFEEIRSIVESIRFH